MAFYNDTEATWHRGESPGIGELRMEALLHINQETLDLALNLFEPQFVSLCYVARGAAVITPPQQRQNEKTLY